MDKVKHFIVSAGIVIVVSFFLPIVYGVVLAVIAGIAKEIHDSRVDVFDLLSDILGIIMGLAVCSIK